MKDTEAVKLAKMQLKAQREARAMGLARQVVASPVFQLVGSVAIAEILENQGILSARWAGALEGGVIAMVGLQAMKEYGVWGTLMELGGLGTGSLIGETLGGGTPATGNIANQIKQGLSLASLLGAL
jgi:hypothetical protein